MDDLIDGLLAEETAAGADDGVEPTQPDSASAAQRERLATIAAGGQARQYLGKEWTMEEIDSLGDDEVGRLYGSYEARLGAAMTKTLGRATLQLYTATASMFLPIPPENRQPLMAELESDPFIEHALNRTACEVYYRYGKILAPITAAVTTVKYCRFEGHQCPRRIEDGGQGCDDDAHAGDAHAGDCCGGCCGATTSATSVEGDGRDNAGNQSVA